MATIPPAKVMEEPQASGAADPEQQGADDRLLDLACRRACAHELPVADDDACQDGLAMATGKPGRSFFSGAAMRAIVFHPDERVKGGAGR